MSEDGGETFNPWTPQGSARLLEAAALVAEAVQAHARAVVAADGEIGSVFAASEALLPALLAYSDAQFGFTGNGFPFGVLYEWTEDDDEDEADAVEEWPALGLSVVQRHDYTVSDLDAVIAAGRKAYLRVWPEDTEADAAADVTGIGRALDQVAHADGWDSLSGVDGAGFIGVLKQDDLLGHDPGRVGRLGPAGRGRGPLLAGGHLPVTVSRGLR